MAQTVPVDYQSKDYKRSRAAYMAECAFEYFVTLLAADAFLAKLLTHIGLSDAMIGLVSSFITLAFLFQLVAVFVSHKIRNKKRTVMMVHTAAQFMFFLLYMIPFMPLSIGVKSGLAVVFQLLAYAINYVVASVLFRWANSYVDPLNRGEYSAKKEMISLVLGIVFSLFAGFVMDQFETRGNIEGGFLFMAIAIFVITALDFISLLLIKKEESGESQETTISIKDIIKNTLGNRNFRNVVIMTIFLDIGRYMSIGFLGTFKTKDLLMSVAFVQGINMVANLARFALSIPFGKYSDKRSFASGLKLALILTALAFGFNIFTTRESWFCIVIYTVLYNASLAGVNQNTFNIVYSYVKPEYFVAATAIKNSIGGLFGFGASVVAGKILDYVQQNGNTFLGIPMYGQQLLSAISFAFILITVLFIHFVIGKQQVIKQ